MNKGIISITNEQLANMLGFAPTEQLINVVYEPEREVTKFILASASVSSHTAPKPEGGRIEEFSLGNEYIGKHLLE